MEDESKFVVLCYSIERITWALRRKGSTTFSCLAKEISTRHTILCFSQFHLKVFLGLYYLIEIILIPNALVCLEPFCVDATNIK